VSPAAREPLPDALRAAALLGVLLVNAGGYATAPWGPLLGVPQPPGDRAALWTLGLQAALVQGKAYPLLAFLFGMGLALALKDRSAQAEQRSRMRLRKLLALGVVHGVLLYFGDVLTMYALCGYLVLPHVNEPLRTLRRRLLRSLGWALGAVLFGLAGTAALAGMPIQTTPVEQTLRGVAGLAGFVALNATAYLGSNVTGLLLFLPLVRLCMLAGVLAARLRLLVHRRWHAARERLIRVGLPAALAANAAYGGLAAHAAAIDDQRSWWIESLSPLVGLPLTLCLVAAAAQAWCSGCRRWVRALAPLGRRTLTVYVGHAIWCLILFSGIGFAWQPSTPVLFGFCLLTWGALAALAHAGEGRWPLEAWMGRRT
jgi:uncharacterized protein